MGYRFTDTNIPGLRLRGPGVKDFNKNAYCKTSLFSGRARYKETRRSTCQSNSHTVDQFPLIGGGGSHFQANEAGSGLGYGGEREPNLVWGWSCGVVWVSEGFSL